MFTKYNGPFEDPKNTPPVDEGSLTDYEKQRQRYLTEAKTLARDFAADFQRYASEEGSPQDRTVAERGLSACDAIARGERLTPSVIGDDDPGIYYEALVGKQYQGFVEPGVSGESELDRLKNLLASSARPSAELATAEATFLRIRASTAKIRLLQAVTENAGQEADRYQASAQFDEEMAGAMEAYVKGDSSGVVLVPERGAVSAYSFMRHEMEFMAGR